MVCYTLLLRYATTYFFYCKPLILPQSEKLVQLLGFERGTNVS